ncbi:hypothetical protein [Amycolatopsis samaneae]|uniref:YbjN domain-containing protein n=1 Tax=Amycolatopsis samaneae TaxID=664691 RepID=A0ABW5GSR7_9PSEU
MAEWRDLVTFIRQSYRVVRDEPDEIRIRLVFGSDDPDTENRAQIVVIAHEIFDRKEDWVQIATPFARADEVDLLSVLTEIGETIVVGGAVVMGEHLVLRHSLPLINLDINEFIDPLELVAGSAELLEQQFTGRDDY